MLYFYDMSSPKKSNGYNKGWENIKPAKKGEVRNPNGRPKKEFCIPEILRRLANEPSRYDPDNKTRLERICLKAIEQAEGGDKDARAWVADRMEGKAIDRIITREADAELIIE